jgi:hypothetical protein
MGDTISRRSNVKFSGSNLHDTKMVKDSLKIKKYQSLKRYLRFDFTAMSGYGSFLFFVTSAC